MFLAVFWDFFRLCFTVMVLIRRQSSFLANGLLKQEIARPEGKVDGQGREEGVLRVLGPEIEGGLERPAARPKPARCLSNIAVTFFQGPLDQILFECTDRIGEGFGRRAGGGGEEGGALRIDALDPVATLRDFHPSFFTIHHDLHWIGLFFISSQRVTEAVMR
jgi:hypothetical protein